MGGCLAIGGEQKRPQAIGERFGRCRCTRHASCIFLRALRIQPRQEVFSRCLHRVLAREHIARPHPGRQRRVVVRMCRVHRHATTLPPVFHELSPPENPQYLRGTPWYLGRTKRDIFLLRNRLTLSGNRLVGSCQAQRRSAPLRLNRRSACQSLTGKHNTTPAHLGVKSPRPRIQVFFKRGFTSEIGRSKAGVDDTEGLSTGPRAVRLSCQRAG